LFVTTGADENAREQLEPTSASRFDFIASFAGQWSEYILHRYVVDNQDAIGDILISMQRVGHLLYGQDFGKCKLHHYLHPDSDCAIRRDELRLSTWDRNQAGACCSYYLSRIYQSS
jgi:hypothetical protein